MVFPGTGIFKFKRIVFSRAYAFARVKFRINQMRRVHGGSRPNLPRTFVGPSYLATFFNLHLRWGKASVFVNDDESLRLLNHHWCGSWFCAFFKPTALPLVFHRHSRYFGMASVGISFSIRTANRLVFLRANGVAPR